jgi:hypothetical protein
MLQDVRFVVSNWTIRRDRLQVEEASIFKVAAVQQMGGDLLKETKVAQQVISKNGRTGHWMTRIGLRHSAGTIIQSTHEEFSNAVDSAISEVQMGVVSSSGHKTSLSK